MNSYDVEQMKTNIDMASAVISGAALGGFLPPFAALLTIVWTGIRIYESETVQRLVCRWWKWCEEKLNGTKR